MYAKHYLICQNSFQKDEDLEVLLGDAEVHSQKAMNTFPFSYHDISKVL